MHLFLGAILLIAVVMFNHGGRGMLMDIIMTAPLWILGLSVPAALYVMICGK